MKAMVLAAGRGTRMGALSEHMPKPLVPVLGKPLLDRILAHLYATGIGPTVINVHHLADQLEAHLQSHLAKGDVVISDERDALLETGGGVKKALSLLGDDAFLVINSDALWVDGNAPTLRRLQEAFDPAIMDVLLLTVKTDEAAGYDGVGDFISDTMKPGPVPVQFRGDAAAAPVMYGGIQIVNPSLYDGTPDGAWSNREIFRKAAAKNRLYGLLHDGLWMHVGSPEGVTLAEARLKAAGAV